MTGYSLVGAAVIVTSGALGDVLGRRKVFLAGLGLFIASCALIALSTSAAGVVGGRMIQGASGATILACGMSLLSVAASGTGQLKAITLWGAASAAGAALGPLIGGVLVEIDRLAGPVLDRRRDRGRLRPAHARDGRGVARPEPLALDRLGRHGPDRAGARPADSRAEQGQRLGLGLGSRRSAASRSRSSRRSLFVAVERRATAPLVDLRLLRNRVLVGATLAILIVAGTINALMYVLSLYFQNPAGSA